MTDSHHLLVVNALRCPNCRHRIHLPQSDAFHPSDDGKGFAHDERCPRCDAHIRWRLAATIRPTHEQEKCW